VRRATVVALAFIAALAAPVRAACGATCVQPEPAEVVRPSASACHETAAKSQPADTPAGHCSHDHSTSVRPAPKAGGDIVTLQPVALAPTAAPHPIAFIVAPAMPAGDTSRGSPPLRLNPPLLI
jgi:hypothetical protein